MYWFGSSPSHYTPAKGANTVFIPLQAGLVVPCPLSSSLWWASSAESVYLYNCAFSMRPCLVLTTVPFLQKSVIKAVSRSLPSICPTCLLQYLSSPLSLSFCLVPKSFFCLASNSSLVHRHLLYTHILYAQRGGCTFSKELMMWFLWGNWFSNHKSPRGPP